MAKVNVFRRLVQAILQRQADRLVDLVASHADRWDCGRSLNLNVSDVRFAGMMVQDMLLHTDFVSIAGYWLMLDWQDTWGDTL